MGRGDQLYRVAGLGRGDVQTGVGAQKSRVRGTVDVHLHQGVALGLSSSRQSDGQDNAGEQQDADNGTAHE